MRKISTLLLLVFITSLTYASQVDTLSIYSASMKKNVKCVIVTPGNYKSGNKNYPVVYLLHGYSGGFNNWVKKVPFVLTAADQYQVIIVCPDGAFGSWYFDSPVDPTMRYETNVAVEVPAYIDSHYKTIQSRNARAITGLSMGGHGGLYLGWRHSDYFGACGSISGAIGISYITKGYGMDKLLGDSIKNKKYYEEYSFMHEMETPPKQPMAIILDCGTEDFIIGMSREAHEKLLKLKIPHDYSERPGKHDWAYWANSLEYQMLFFHNFFEKGKM
ncbi:MAG: XynC protein [Chitinophagaceae bacterium]|nr:XynC protein [Chitinophagaceae bacterium]